MVFCKKCGSLLIPKKVDGKAMLVCPKGCDADTSGTDTSAYTVKTSMNKQERKIIVVKDVVQDIGAETVEGSCPKCGFNKVVEWTVDQSQAEKEMIIIFNRCVQCGHTWRDIGD